MSRSSWGGWSGQNQFAGTCRDLTKYFDPNSSLLFILRIFSGCAQIKLNIKTQLHMLPGSSLNISVGWCLTNQLHCQT